MSLAATTTVTPTNSSDANFRAWGSAIGVKMAAAGLVNTADTGQINWTTVIAPVAGSTVKGYEVWRFADTLQATKPVFILLEYGSGTATNDPSIHITFGSGSNGAGALTGVLSVRYQMQIVATATAVTAYWSGDTGRFTFAFKGAGTTTSLAVMIERSKDTTGAETGEAVCFLTRNKSTYGQVAWNTTTGSAGVIETNLGAMLPALAPFGTTGSTLAVYPIFFNKGIYFPPGLGAFVYENALMAVDTAVAFSVYGATHTYMTLGSTSFGGVGSVTRGGGSAPALMIRYE